MFELVNKTTSKDPAVISMHLPNGVTFLLNIFIELDLPVYRNSMNLFWNKKDGYLNLRNYPRFRYSQWFPAFEKKMITYRTDLAIEWMHEWPFIFHQDRKILLFLRDGRDALYSRFNRMPDVANFEEYLDIPIEPFGLTTPYTWALYHRIWRVMLENSKNDIRVVKFEDIKAEPDREIRKILEFLDLDRTDAEIQAAIEASNVEKAQINYKKSVADIGMDLKAIRKGMPFEWKSIWQDEYDIRLPVDFSRVLLDYGYEPLSGYTADEHRISQNDSVSVKGLTTEWFNQLYPNKFLQTDLGKKSYDSIEKFLILNSSNKLIRGKIDVYGKKNDHQLSILRLWSCIFPYYRLRYARKFVYIFIFKVMSLLQFFLERSFPRLWRTAVKIGTQGS